MLSLFMILPLLFLLASTYYYNEQEMVETKSYVIKVSILEGILSYLVIMILFLQGFISIFFVLLLIFVFIAVFSFIIMSFAGQFGIKGILELETIKNNIILFGVTILPFYVFLTVFRYLPV